MRKKLIITYFLIIAITICVTVAFSWNKINTYFFDQVLEESKLQIKLLEQIVTNEYEENINLIPASEIFQEFAISYGDTTELRITIIDNEGNVLADSLNEPDTMENHKYRPEFKEALLGNGESSLRYSSTMGMYLFYYAEPYSVADFDGAIRVSIPVDDIEYLVWDMVQSIILGLVFGVILSIIVAYFFTRKFMEPIDELTTTAKIIASGDYDNKVYIDNKDQIGELADAFNSMTYTMRKNLWDIEQKNAELESILTSIDFGLAAVDESYRILLNNEPFLKILNIQDDIEGKYFYEIMRNSKMFSVIEKSIEEDEFIVEEAILNIGQTEKVIRFSATPIKSRTAKNMLHGILLIAEDVTNLRKLERIRQEFVSNVTHELKTPLTSIKGFVETLRNGALEEPEVASRFLDIIDIESERLTTLIEDILSLSEIENMKGDKNIRPIQLGDVIHDVVEMLHIPAEEKGLELITDIQEDLDPFRCNENRIKQLLINLIGNSVKYTEEGSILITCRETIDEEDIILTIKDTGIGIENEHLERLFERFYRVDKGRSRKMGGTGLGLSIVKHIVELYNGSINVKSEPGIGTEMKIRLPKNGR